MLQDRLELSERRACRVTGQHRSTQRRVAARGRGDDALRTELHAFSRGHPRWGYRRAWATLREEGWGVNRKRVQRGSGVRKGCAFAVGMPVTRHPPSADPDVPR